MAKHRPMSAKPADKMKVKAEKDDLGTSQKEGESELDQQLVEARNENTRLQVHSPLHTQIDAVCCRVQDMITKVRKERQHLEAFQMNPARKVRAFARSMSFECMIGDN